MTDPKDRREHPRHPCDREFEGAPAGREGRPAESFRCRAVNASEGGLMIETPMPLATGQRIELFLRARDRSRSCAAVAEVVWCKPHAGGFQAGVKFLSRREDFLV